MKEYEQNTLPGAIAILWRRKWYIAASLSVALGLGAVYLQYAPPVYVAGAKLLVKRPAPSLANQRTEKDSDFLATQAEIIRSPAVVQSAVDSLGYSTDPDALSAESPVIRVMDSLQVRLLLGTNVLSLSFSGPDSQQAKRTVEAIIDSYQDYVHQSERDAHLEAIRLLVEGEKQLRGDLLSMEEDFRALRQKSPLLGQHGDSARVQRELLTGLGQTLREAKSRRMELENRIASLDGLSSDQLASSTPHRWVSARQPAEDIATEVVLAATGVDEPNSQALWQVAQETMSGLDHLQEELVAAKARERDLAERFGPKHPDLRAVRQQIASWEELMRQRLEAAPEVLQQQLVAAKLQEQQLASLYDEGFAKAKQLDHFLLQEQQALDHIQRTQEIHNSVLEQLRQWQLADQALVQGGTGVIVEVLQAPALAQQQVWPPARLLLATCAAIGLMSGMGMAMLLGSAESRPRRAPAGRGLPHAQPSGVAS